MNVTDQVVRLIDSTSTSESPLLRRFEASRLWEFNVYGAVVAGIGGFVVLCVVAGIIISSGRGLDVYLIVGAMIASVILTLLCLFPGNLVAVHPFAVELEAGKGLRLLAPLKEVYIPIEDVKAVRRSYLELGWAVKLNRRHGALTRFSIHGGFGRQGGELARAIQEEIAHRGSS